MYAHGSYCLLANVLGCEHVARCWLPEVGALTCMYQWALRMFHCIPSLLLSAVRFRAVIFRPFIGEVIIGRIRRCSPEGVHG